MRDLVAMVLAGGRTDALGVLTEKRPQSAIPFGGMFRVIDFVLTNLAESGVEKVGILSQYKPLSLMDHVGIGRPWDYNGRTRELSFLPPYQGSKEIDWYKGTADAVYQNLHFIERHKPKDVLVLSGDHVYRMDYRPLIAMHREMKADLTMVFKPIEVSSPCRFGIGVVGKNGRVLRYFEKPEVPESNLVSLTIYCFRREVLEEQVKENARTGKTFHIYDEIIPQLVQHGKVYGFIFRRGWEYLRPVSAFYDAHMRLLRVRGEKVSMERVRTNLEEEGLAEAPPVYFSSGGVATRSLVAPGSMIFGGVRRSVVFPYVRVEEDTFVAESVVFHRCHIARGARVRRAILDKGCFIGEGAVLDGGDGLIVLGKGVKVMDGAVLKGTMEILPDRVVG